MAKKEFKDMMNTELNKELLALRKEQFNINMQHASGTLKQTHQLKRIQKDIARVKTFLNQKQGEAE